MPNTKSEFILSRLFLTLGALRNEYSRRFFFASFLLIAQKKSKIRRSQMKGYLSQDFRCKSYTASYEKKKIDFHKKPNHYAKNPHYLA